MKITIFYFSGTGNTSWVARELVSCFSTEGHDATAVSVEKITPQQANKVIAQSHIIGFGYPIYGSDLPHIMKEFIKNIATVASQPTLVFCTQWKWSGDGSHEGAVFVREKGFRVRWSEHFLMPNNVCTPMLPFPYTNDSHKIQPTLKRAQRKAAILANAVLHDTTHLRGFNPLSIVAGCVQRIPFRSVFHTLRNNMAIDPEHCSDCGLCVDICPVGNFVRTSDTIVTKAVCILCLRCYNFCPQSAITYKKIPHNHKRGTPYKGPSGCWDGSANASWPK